MINPESDRHRNARLNARQVRIDLIERAGECMACHRFSVIGSVDYEHGPLACHEILSGPLREKTLDQVCSLLVLCWDCNSNKFTDRELWPVPRQLALLKAWFPDNYDLQLFNKLRNENAPNYVEQSEVDQYRDEFKHLELGNQKKSTDGRLNRRFGRRQRAR